MRELLGIPQLGLLGERLDDRADCCQVIGARLPDRGLPVVHLEQDVDERAALEVVFLEPLVEEVEDREQLLFRGLSAAPGLRLDPVPRPKLLALLQERQHEVVLGREVAVEGGLGDRGAPDHLVDADRSHAAPREQLVGAVENSLSSSRNRRCCHCLAHRTECNPVFGELADQSVSHPVGAVARLGPCRSGARRSSWMSGSFALSSHNSRSWNWNRSGRLQRVGTTPSGWWASATPSGSRGGRSP